MQAPKNGFFYVLDRATGELISAQPFATVNWAKGIDMKTGRPIETAEARYGETGSPFIAQPGPGGAHSWQPMSYSPHTGLVYFPVMEAVFPYFPDKDFRKRTLAWNTGVDFNAGSLPTDQGILDQIKAGLKGHLVAWDPVRQREVWRVQYEHPWNGGALSTAGDVVFHGDALGEFAAYDARTGASSGRWRPAQESWLRRLPTSSAMSNTSRSRWAGAVRSGWPPASSPATHTSRQTHRVSLPSSWAEEPPCRRPDRRPGRLRNRLPTSRRRRPSRRARPRITGIAARATATPP